MFQANNKLFALFNDLAAIEVKANQLSDVPKRWRDEVTALSDGGVPMLLIVGYQNVGKSTLVEALIGEKFNFVSSKNGATTRPLKLSLLRSDSTKADSEWEVLLDAPNGDGTTTKIWTPMTKDQVTKYLKKTNKNQPFSADPIEIRVKRPNVLQLNIIDLPGLQLVGNKDNIGKLESITRFYLKNENSIVVCCEQAGTDLNSLSGFKFVQEALSEKPNWTDRVIMVHTMFDHKTREWSTYDPKDWKEIAQYFSRNDKSVVGYSSVPKFYVTLLHPGLKGVDPDNLHTILTLQSDDDQKVLHKMDVDDKVIKNVGFTALQKHLHSELNNFYQRSIATLSFTIQRFEKFAAQCEKKVNELLPTNIRFRLLRTAQEITKKLEQLLAGYYSDASSKFGRTFEEDLNHCFPREPERDIGDIPYASYKLCGGGQYRRMISYLFKNTNNIDAVALCKKLCPNATLTGFRYLDVTDAAKLAKAVTHCLQQYSVASGKVDENANCIEKLFNYFVIAAVECLIDEVPKSEDGDMSTYAWLKRYPSVTLEVQDFFTRFFAGLSRDVKDRMKHNKIQVEPSKLYVGKFSISPTDDVNGIVIGSTSLNVSRRKTLGEVPGLFTQSDNDVIYEKMGEVFKAYLIDQLELMQQVLDSYYKASLFHRLAVEVSSFYHKYTDTELLQLIGENIDQIRQQKRTIEELKDLCKTFRRTHMV